MPPPRSSRPPAPRVRIHALRDTALLAELGTRLDTAPNTPAIALAAALKQRRDCRQPLAEELELQRRHVRRALVPAGSVAIAGRQTGIYPLPSPGGWHLIGSTSVKLFLPDRDPPCLFRAGDRVKFFASTT